MINTIFSSSVLILMIIAIRFIFKGKINPMVLYSLWGLVALRLVTFNLLDMHPIKNTFSVMNIAGNFCSAVLNIPSKEIIIYGNGQVTANHVITEIVNNVRTGIVTSGDGIPAVVSIDWQLVLMIVWIFGEAAICLWLCMANFRFSKKLLKERRFLCSIETGGHRKNLPVYLVEELYSPCLMSNMREIAIYVTPKVAADEETFRYAVEHELGHYKHYDLTWSVIRSCLLVFYWFNPLVWIAAILSKRDCELACDYSVIRKIGKENRLSYGKTLVNMVGHQPELKFHVFLKSTTMCGSFSGMKERINLIVNNNKMKVSSLIAMLLMATLSVGFTFTTAPDSDSDSGQKHKQTAEVTYFATKWADAVTGRDAKTIYQLCENKDLYLTIGGVAENGELWMGVSSPWPWNKDYKIHILDSSSMDIYYYFMTSSPTVYVAKENVTIKKIDGQYKAVADDWTHFTEVPSKADFDDAYQFGVPRLLDFAEAYQHQADDNQGHNKGRKEILENPATAAIDQLNLEGAKVGKIVYHPVYKKAVVTFKWRDGESTVNLIQPTFTDEKGNTKQATIWVVANENQSN